MPISAENSNLECRAKEVRFWILQLFTHNFALATVTVISGKFMKTLTYMIHLAYNFIKTNIGRQYSNYYVLDFLYRF